MPYPTAGDYATQIDYALGLARTAPTLDARRSYTAAAIAWQQANQTPVRGRTGVDRLPGRIARVRAALEQNNHGARSAATERN